MAKIVRAYVPKEADRQRVATLTGLRMVNVHAAETVEPPKMRAGELLGVEDLTCFGDNRDDIAERIKAVRAQGADIVEIGSGRLCGDGAVMLAEALQKLARMTPGRKAMMQAAIDTARKRTEDGRCSKERLFELWGSGLSIADVVKQSRWPRSSIFRHFANLGITRAMARLEMENRRKAARKSKRK